MIQRRILIPNETSAVQIVSIVETIEERNHFVVLKSRLEVGGAIQVVLLGPHACLVRPFPKPKSLEVLRNLFDAYLLFGRHSEFWVWLVIGCSVAGGSSKII